MSTNTYQREQEEAKRGVDNENIIKEQLQQLALRFRLLENKAFMDKLEIIFSQRPESITFQDFQILRINAIKQQIQYIQKVQRIRKDGYMNELQFTQYVNDIYQVTPPEFKKQDLDIFLVESSQKLEEELKNKIICEEDQQQQQQVEQQDETNNDSAMVIENNINNNQQVSSQGADEVL